MVLTKRGSRGSMKPTSAISSTLASSSLPPKLSANAWRFSLHARARMVARIWSARLLQRAWRSSLREDRGDLGETIARGPAHQRRRGVDAGAGAQLPHAGVGLVVQAPGLLAHALELGEIARVGAPEQAMVEESLRCAENDVAVDVVLDVLERLVADAHRRHAAVAGERRHHVSR